MKNIIYLDNAATSKLDIEAFEAMKPFLLDDYSNVSQPYSFSKSSKLALKKAREEIAKCINADIDEIFFTSGGSESDNWALKCFGNVNSQINIVTSNIEHKAILNTCSTLTQLNNYNIEYLNVDKFGIISSNYLSNFFKDKTNLLTKETLVSIMLANNEIGTIEPIKELAQIAHNNGAYFHTDAVQALGHIKVDVKDLGVDMLSASAHKFNGPKGIGFLYIKKGTPIHSLINGGSQENMLRAGTENVASIVGMSVALKNNILNLEEIRNKLLFLEHSFISELSSYEIDFIRNGSDRHIPGNVNISIKGANGEMLLHRLDLMGYMISTGSACDSVNNQVSHVIKAINVPNDYAEGTIRISFGKYNSLTDAADLALAIKKILS